MKKLIAIVVVGLTFGLLSSAHAFYGGVNYMHANTDFAGLADADVGVLALKGGHELNDNFAVEGRLGFGITDDEIVPGVSVELDYFWGIYARPGVRANEFNFYGLLGYSGIEGTMTGGGSEDETDFSYGVGVEFMMNDKMGLSLEYLVLPEFDLGGGLEVETDSFNLGFSMKF